MGKKIIKKEEEKKKLSFDEWKKTIPSKTDEEIGDIEYADEEEEEEMDTTFLLEPWEEKYYDDEGNFYPDGYKDNDGNTIEGAKKEIKK